jgi:hypothetical protein
MSRESLMPIDQKNIDELFIRLSKSKFRSRFRLSNKDSDYLEQKGFSTIEQHAHDFIIERLAPTYPKNDGKQTPMKNHPVFTAQHATGTCCRKCLKKWHNIEIGKELTEEQIDYVVAVVMSWLRKSVNDS